MPMTLEIGEHQFAAALHALLAQYVELPAEVKVRALANALAVGAHLHIGARPVDEELNLLIHRLRRLLEGANVLDA